MMEESVSKDETQLSDNRALTVLELARDQDGLLIKDLTLLPEKTLVDEKRLAVALKVTPRTVRRMVARFELPPPIRLAGRSVWMAGHVLAHIQKTAERAINEADRQARRLRNLGP